MENRGYGLLAIENEDEVSKALEDLFNGKLGPYWHPNRTLVDEHVSLYIKSIELMRSRWQV